MGSSSASTPYRVEPQPKRRPLSAEREYLGWNSASYPIKQKKHWNPLQFEQLWIVGGRQRGPKCVPMLAVPCTPSITLGEHIYRHIDLLDHVDSIPKHIQHHWLEMSKQMQLPSDYLHVMSKLCSFPAAILHGFLSSIVVIGVGVEQLSSLTLGPRPLFPPPHAYTVGVKSVG